TFSLHDALPISDLAVSVVERVQARDLQDRIHQTIYGVVAELVGRGSQVSPTIVLSELQKAGHLVGRLDSTYLFGLVEAAALPSQVGYHVTDVKARSWKRRLWEFGGRVQQAAERGERPPAEDAELLQAWLDELTDVEQSGGMVRAAGVVPAVGGAGGAAGRGRWGGRGSVGRGRVRARTWSRPGSRIGMRGCRPGRVGSSGSVPALGRARACSGWMWPALSGSGGRSRCTS